MIFHRCLILGTILTVAVMLFVGSCAGRPGAKADHCTQVGSSSDLKNHEVPQTSQPASYVPGEVLVRFVEDADEETISAVEANYHVTVKKVLIPSRLYLMKITDGSTVQDLIERLRNNKAVKYAEPNYIRRTR
jgi:hypothetical protein